MRGSLPMWGSLPARGPRLAAYDCPAPRAVESRAVWLSGGRGLRWGGLSG